MAADYPGSIVSFIPKSDGPTQKIMAAHINKLQEEVQAVETTLGTNPHGSVADLKTRLAVILNDNGTFKGPQQIVTAGKAGCSFTTIQSAINSISDASISKIYTVLVFPGTYIEAITLKNYVNIVAIDPLFTIITRQVTDNNIKCDYCYLNFTIESSVSHGLFTRHASSVVRFDGNISSSNGVGAYCQNGSQTVNGNISSSTNKGAYVQNGSQTVNGNVSSSANHGAHCENSSQTINGNISSSVSYGAYCEYGSLIIKGNVSSLTSFPLVIDAGNLTLNGNLNCSFNDPSGHGVLINGGTFIMQNGKIFCTHVNSKAIFSYDPFNAYLMNVWGNRQLHSNVTDILSGFNYNINVPS